MITFAIYIIMLIASSIERSQEQSYFQQISKQYDTMVARNREFRDKHGANDDLVHEALLQEYQMSPLAIELYQRMTDEMGLDYRENSSVCRCHLIAVAILAQQGKIPNDFIDFGISWAMECYEKLSGGTFRSAEAAKIMEAFVRWYDIELMAHGVPEPLYQSITGCHKPGTIHDGNDGLPQNVVRICSVERIGFGKVLFWPSCPNTLIGSSFYNISRRLIK